MYGNDTLSISLRKEKRGLIHDHYSGLKPSWDINRMDIYFTRQKKGGGWFYSTIGKWYMI